MVAKVPTGGYFPAGGRVWEWMRLPLWRSFLVSRGLANPQPIQDILTGGYYYRRIPPRAAGFMDEPEVFATPERNVRECNFYVGVRRHSRIRAPYQFCVSAF